MEGFDDIIRGKLAALDGRPVAGAVPDWGALANRLDGEAFDASLREALEPDAAPAAAAVPGWDRLAERLDASAAVEGDAFDRLVTEKLSRAAAPAAGVSPTASWRRLSHRMDTFWPLRRRLLRYRVLEVAAAAAVIFTLLPFLPEYDRPGADAALAVGQPHPGPPAADHRAGRVDDPARAGAVDFGADDRRTPDADAPSALAETETASGTPESTRSATAPLPTPLSLARDAYRWLAGAAEPPLPTGEAVASAPRTALDRTGSTAGPQEYPAGESSGPTAAPRGARAPAYEVTDLLTPASSTSLALTAEGGLTTPIVRAPARAGGWRLALEAGPSVWQIHTPRQANLRLESATAREAGLSALLSATKSLGPRAELGLGVGVSTIDYDPDFPTLVQDDRYRTGGGQTWAQAETLERVSVTVAQVPLELRFDVLAGGDGHRRTRLWAKAGASANVVVGSEYGLRRQVGELEIFTLSAPAQSSVESPEGLFSENVKPGVFEPGGELAENAFVTARLGLEAEVMLGERLSLFGGADYDRFLPLTDGLGPTDDQLSQLGVSLGLRFSL